MKRKRRCRTVVSHKCRRYRRISRLYRRSRRAKMYRRVDAEKGPNAQLAKKTPTTPKKTFKDSLTLTVSFVVKRLPNIACQEAEKKVSLEIQPV